MKKTLAIVLALAMVLCMIPAAFATTYTAEVKNNQYNIHAALVRENKDGSINLDWKTNDKAYGVNSYTIEYGYEDEDLDEVLTGKWDDPAKMAIVTIGGFSSEFTKAEPDSIKVTVDGKKLEVNELADYEQWIGWEGFSSTNNEIVMPVQLTKAGYTTQMLIQVTGTIKEDNGNERVLTETAVITLRLENTSAYKTGKTATISKVETNSNQLDAYVVGSRFYLDFAADTVSGHSLEEITITYKDNNGNLFDTATWAYTNDTFAAVINGVQQTGPVKDGMQLDDSAATYVVRDCLAANNAKVTFKLENGSAIYETKEYTVVVRTGIKESDPKGIVFAESTKTIKIGEEYTPVVLGVETGKKVDAKIEIGTVSGTSNGAVNAQYVDIIDNETIVGTQEGVAYVTAKYTTNDGKVYTASSMKITVTAQDVEDDDDTTDGATYIVTASSLRVRSGAGTNFSQIGSLKNGATVKVESIANGWAKLENGGYVSAQYLAKVVDNGEAQTWYVTARTLNVRKGPGTSYAKVGTLSRGTAVQVVGFSGNWAKLSNGYYVSTSYLAK